MTTHQWPYHRNLYKCKPWLETQRRSKKYISIFPISLSVDEVHPLHRVLREINHCQLKLDALNGGWRLEDSLGSQVIQANKGWMMSGFFNLLA